MPEAPRFPPTPTLPRKGGGDSDLRSEGSPLPLRDGLGGGGNAEGAYLRDPAAIYRRSFEIIRREARLDHLPPDIAGIAVRLIHACGMTDIAADLSFTGDVAQAARKALSMGAPIFCDSAMVAAGIMRRHLPASNPVICTLDDAAVPPLARERATTRSATAVDLWDSRAEARLRGGIVAIGSAPTALFRLLELAAQGGPLPAAILAFPVGFVGAVESKEALVASGLPHLTLRGRRGGSALAAAAVNALILPREDAVP